MNTLSIRPDLVPEYGDRVASELLRANDLLSESTSLHFFREWTRRIVVCSDASDITAFNIKQFAVAVKLHAESVKKIVNIVVKLGIHLENCVMKTLMSAHCGYAQLRHTVSVACILIEAGCILHNVCLDLGSGARVDWGETLTVVRLLKQRAVIALERLRGSTSVPMTAKSDMYSWLMFNVMALSVHFSLMSQPQRVISDLIEKWPANEIVRRLSLLQRNIYNLCPDTQFAQQSPDAVPPPPPAPPSTDLLEQSKGPKILNRMKNNRATNILNGVKRLLGDGSSSQPKELPKLDPQPEEKTSIESHPNVIFGTNPTPVTSIYDNTPWVKMDKLLVSDLPKAREREHLETLKREYVGEDDAAPLEFTGSKRDNTVRNAPDENPYASVDRWKRIVELSGRSTKAFETHGDVEKFAFGKYAEIYAALWDIVEAETQRHMGDFQAKIRALVQANAEANISLGEKEQNQRRIDEIYNQGKEAIKSRLSLNPDALLKKWKDLTHNEMEFVKRTGHEIDKFLETATEARKASAEEMDAVIQKELPNISVVEALNSVFGQQYPKREVANPNVMSESILVHFIKQFLGAFPDACTHVVLTRRGPIDIPVPIQSIAPIIVCAMLVNPGSELVLEGFRDNLLRAVDRTKRDLLAK